MRRLGWLGAIVVCWAVAQPCLAQTALTSPADVRVPVPVDIALRDGGLLLGQLVQPQGVPIPDASVMLCSGSKQLASGTTNRTGYFAFSGLRPGTYQLITPAGMATCQAWAVGTAPPAAQPGLLIVAGQNTVRGQYAAGAYAGKLAGPLVLGGLVATAIAVPVAIANSHRSSASGE